METSAESSRADAFHNGRGGILTVELRDPFHADFSRADGFAFIVVRAIAEAFLVHAAAPS